MSHIRRIVLAAVIAVTFLAGSAGAATARPIGSDTVSMAATPVATPEPRASASGGGSDLTLPIAFAAGAVLLVVVGTAGYAHRARTGRGAIA
jgi:hypothetical protein